MTPATKVSEITLQELEEFFTRILTKQFPLLLDDAMQHIYLPTIEDMIDRKLNPIKDSLRIMRLRIGAIEDKLDSVTDRLELYMKKIDRHLLLHNILDVRLQQLEKKRNSFGITVSDKPKKTYG